MTKEQLAAQLNGREYGDEMSQQEELDAKVSGLVVVFGCSDDNIELRGAVYGEQGCYEGGEIKIHARGILEDHETPCDCDFCGYRAISQKCASIRALWCKEPDYSWTYKTAIPHACFDVLEDGGKYCRGIVFDWSALPSL